MEKICVAIRVKPPSIKQESVTKGHEWRVVDKTIALCSAAGTLVSGHSFSFGKNSHLQGREHICSL
jgi:hypothetical protein